MTQEQNGGRHYKLSPDDARRALAVYAGGKSFVEAARTVGVDKSTLRKTLERLGLRYRYQRPRA